MKPQLAVHFHRIFMAHLSMEMMIPLDVSTNFACSLGPQVDGADQSNQPPTVPAIDSTRQSMPATPFNESIHQLAPFFLDICSGVSKPLSAALCNRNKTVLAIHLLLHSSMNLLNDEFFEQLLQLYMWIRPCCLLRYCTELWFVFSSSLTTWRSELDGVEGLSAYEAIQLQESSLLFDRCAERACITHLSGGHAHVEQPSGATSWREPLAAEMDASKLLQPSVGSSLWVWIGYLQELAICIILYRIRCCSEAMLSCCQCSSVYCWRSHLRRILYEQTICSVSTVSCSSYRRCLGPIIIYRS